MPALVRRVRTEGHREVPGALVTVRPPRSHMITSGGPDRAGTAPGDCRKSAAKPACPGTGPAPWWEAALGWLSCEKIRMGSRPYWCQLVIHT